MKFFNKMTRGKKILSMAIAGAAILLVAFMVVGVVSMDTTGAWFKDTTTAQNNTITAGTLDLTVNGENTVTMSDLIFGSKLVPGAWDNLGHANIKNTGNTPGKLSFSIKGVVNNENSIGQPEAAAGDTSANMGELSSKLKLSIQENVAPWTRYTAMLMSNGQTAEGRILNPGEEIQVVFYVTWGSTSNDNIAQGDSVEFDLEINLNQIH